MKTSTAEGKTPVSFLQELCTKWGVTPVYQLTAHNGPVHEPLFEFTVKAGDRSAVGSGSSKKKAKHCAAEALLSLINSAPNGERLFQPTSDSVHNGHGALKSHKENAVGRLQELLQKRHWPPPVYECANECGPAHAREFVCTIHLFSMTQRGTGPSKKFAKKNAAQAMLQEIEHCSEMPNSSGLNVADRDNSLLLETELVKTVEALKLGVQKIDTLSPQASQQINQFYYNLKSKTGKTLASLQTLALNVPATNYCQMLEEIAEEQAFTANYVDLHEPTVDGKCQCLVQISSMPVAVCYGTGCSRDEAHIAAAHNTLQYLKIMTRKA